MLQSLRETILALQHKKISSLELVQHSLRQIKQYKHLNAFITINEEQALLQAKQADLYFKNKQNKPLTGIPLAHKDNFCTVNLPTTCGSKMLENFHAPYQATIVENLAQAGAIMVGKTNMDEFAMGSTNENSYFGAVKNPWNLHCVPGGSSGGSAAAVAAGLVSFATGSDTGGSIRQPAAFCGISGLKPTYGLLSRYGLVAYASSLDQAGPLAKSAEDLAIILQAMASFDAKDSTSVNYPIPNYSHQLTQPLKPLRIGLLPGFRKQQVDSGIQQSVEEALKVFSDAGAQIIDLKLAYQSMWVPCYYVIACAEASTNLSRFDGIRFGYRSQHAKNISELITQSRSEAFGNEVKRRILTGTYVLSSGYFDDYYLQALKIRRLISHELQQCLQQVDVIMGPTTPTTAFKMGQNNPNPIQNYLADVFTVAANLSGLPALSIPIALSNHLPVGLQLIGQPFSEGHLLNIAHWLQQRTDWHQQRPNKDNL